MILEQRAEIHIPSSLIAGTGKPQLVGAGLHVLNPHIAEAVLTKRESVLIDRAEKEITAGAQALAVNLGPGKAMAERTPWVVETLTRAVDTPLFLSSGVTAIDTLMEKYGPTITINAVTADHDSLPGNLATAQKYGAKIVVLLVKPGLVPAGTPGRLQIASEVISMAVDIGLPLGQLYLDPVIACHPDPLAWEIRRGLPDLGPVLETVAAIDEMQEGIRTIVALNNGTPGLTQERKSMWQGRILTLLAEAGLDAVILNCLDRSLMTAADLPKISEK